MLSQRNNMTEADCLKKSRSVATHLFDTAFYKRAQAILVYMHYGSELQTEDIIRQALSDHKQVFVPRVEGKNMDFYEIHSMEDCEEGFHGIPEPKKECPKLIFDAVDSDPKASDVNDNLSGTNGTVSDKTNSILVTKDTTLMILPGLAFDQKGHRLGYGGGYYDRYFERSGADYTKIAAGYDFQWIDEVPSEPHDIPIDIFISDNRCITIDHTSGGKL